MKNLLRILYILFFIIAGMWVFTHPIKTETNLLRAVFSNSTADELVVKLSGRYSSKINVLIESENPDNVSETEEKFYNLIDKNSFKIQDFNFSKILETYKKYNQNLLSAPTYKLLSNKNFDKVEEQAYARLYDPFGIMLIPINEDPFLLFTDYMKSLGNDNLDLIKYNDKYYKILSLDVKNEISLSPELVNNKIKTLVEAQNQLSNENATVYLTGTPIHSYFASSRSMIEINIICLLSSIFIIGLCYYYFRNLKLLLPIAISLIAGIIAGYLMCSLIFPSIHVLTFVFSTTLIGICIDYSLHYFIEGDINKIFKSLTVSMLTTVSAFGILLFSGVEFLKQISVYTMSGLFAVYSMVVLFYPFLKYKVQTHAINFQFPQKFRKLFIIAIAVISLLGLCFIKFNDDIRNMYVPSKKLMASEKLFNSVNGGSKKTSFAVVNGKDLQDVLQKEEKIAIGLEPDKYQAISKFIPSIERQKKNFELRQELYQAKLNTYGTFLSAQDKEYLFNEKLPKEFLSYNQLPIFEEFLLDKNTSLMVLYDFNNPKLITDNDAKYVDVSRDVSAKISHCRVSCLKMLLPIFVLLFGLLAFIYKPKTAAKIIIPSVVAALFAIGLVTITGSEINLFHVLAIFLIIGFGLDYSVFRASGIKSSADAVLLSCMTSIFSFLLLACTSFKLISSLGFILSVGLAVSYMTSLLFNYDEENLS